MNKFPSKETVERLRNRYPAGTRVELVSMNDPYTTLRPGDRGAIEFFDDTGTAFVKWDNGSGLGLVYGEDSFRRVEKEIKYETGADFWRDTAVSHGLDEARVICGNYLATQLKLKQPDDEHKFCRELFSAIYEASAGTADPVRLVYPHSFEDANNRLETSYFHASRERNGECSRDIDAAIDGSCYERYRYNLDLAAMKVLHEYGFERVQAVLMHNIYTHEYDGRYSDSNKQWAQGFHLPEGAFQSAYMNAHPILLEDFTKRTRELYEELGAERFALPGREESGAIVRGYEITRSVFFDDRRGFAIGHNPDAPSPFVCWRFTTENGKRDFYWGTYAGDLKGAADNYTARVIVHLSGGDVKEIPNPPAAAEMTAEQNGNMIDGARNKEQPSEPTTAEREFAAWMAVTENSRHRWVEDDIYRLNGRGALYYTGGEDGTYIRIQSDGVLEAGTYEGAVPHIGEAMFRPAVEQRFNNFSDAMTAAMEAGGRRFLIDMFSAAEHLATEQAARRAYENPRGEKPSVLKRLREAQRAPKPPRKGKTPGKSRGDVEI